MDFGLKIAKRSIKIEKKVWTQWDSNQGPIDQQSNVLPTELSGCHTSFGKKSKIYSNIYIDPIDFPAPVSYIKDHSVLYVSDFVPMLVTRVTTQFYIVNQTKN